MRFHWSMCLICFGRGRCFIQSMNSVAGFSISSKRLSLGILLVRHKKTPTGCCFWIFISLACFTNLLFLLISLFLVSSYCSSSKSQNSIAWQLWVEFRSLPCKGSASDIKILPKSNTQITKNEISLLDHLRTWLTMTAFSAVDRRGCQRWWMRWSATTSSRLSQKWNCPLFLHTEVFLYVVPACRKTLSVCALQNQWRQKYAFMKVLGFRT